LTKLSSHAEGTKNLEISRVLAGLKGSAKSWPIGTVGVIDETGVAKSGKQGAGA